MKTYVIGDVHGCYSELIELLEEIFNRTPRNKSIRLVFVGDLIDKGPNVCGVVKQVDALAAGTSASDIEVVCVMGNHEEKYLRWLRHKEKQKNNPKYKIPIEPKPEWKKLSEIQLKNPQFFSKMPLWYKIPNTNYIVVHGGIAPYLEKLPPVQWSKCKDKSVLYTRYVTPHGKPVSLGNERPGVDKWWGEVYDGRFGFAIYGHQASKDVVKHTHAVGIDTGCVYGEKLTAFCVNDGTFLSVLARKRYAEFYSSEGLV